MLDVKSTVNNGVWAISAVAVISTPWGSPTPDVVTSSTAGQPGTTTLRARKADCGTISGEELDNILFSDPEFAAGYEEFSRELDEHIDSEFRAGKMNPIKYYRLKQDMSQFDLAKAIGVRQPHISRWESGIEINVSVKYLSKIAKALNIPMEALYHAD